MIYLGEVLLTLVICLYIISLLVGGLVNYKLYKDDYSDDNTYTEYIYDFIVTETKDICKKLTILGKIGYILIVIILVVPMCLISTIIFVLIDLIGKYFILLCKYLFVKKDYR